MSELKFGLVISADGTAAIRTLDDLDAGLDKVDKASGKAGKSTSSAFERMQQRARGLGSTLVNVAKKVTMFGGAFAGVVGIVTGSQLSLANEVKQFAQVANVSVEKFQELASGAKLYNVEQDKLADILKDTNDRVGDFMQTGGGAMADFFENIAPKVGVTADMFKDLSGADALQLYYSSLEKANLSQAEMVFYLEAIASDATLLQPLLANNGAEFDRLGTAARDAGMIMSEIDIENARKIKGTLSEMGQMFNGFKVAAFKAVMPTLLSLADAFANNKEQIISWIGSFSDNLSSIVPRIIGFAGAVITTITEFMQMPIVINAVSVASDVLMTSWQAMQDGIQSISDLIAPLISWFREYQEVIIPLASGIGAAAGAFLLFNGAVAAWTAIGTLATAVTTGFGIAVGIATSPVTLILGAIAALVAVGVLLYRNWDTIKAKAAEVFNSLPAPVQEAFGNIKQAFDTVKEWAGIAFDFLAPYVKTIMGVVSAVISAQWDVVKGVFSTSFEVIKGIASTSWATIKAIFTAGITAVAIVFNTGFNLVKNTVQTAFNAIKALARGDIKGFVSIISDGLKNTVGIVTSGVGSIVKAFGSLGKKLYSIGVDAVQGLVNGIRNKIKDAIAVARDLSSSVSNTIKNFFIIRSPSRLMTKFGGYLPEGMANGIKAKSKLAVDAMKAVAQKIKDKVKTLHRDIALFGKTDELSAFQYDVAQGVYGADDNQINYIANLIKQKQALADNAKATESLFNANQQVAQSLASINKQIALFGNKDTVIALKYDIEQGLHNEASEAKVAELLTAQSRLQQMQQAEKVTDFATQQQSLLEQYAFETSLIGKQANEIDRLKFSHDLLNQAKQASKGLSEQAQQQMLEATHEIIAQREELIALREQQQVLQDNNWVAGIQSGFQSLVDGARSLNETMRNATTGAFNKMSDSLATFVATGKGSFKDLTASILQDISKMLIKWAFFKALSGIGGAIGGNFGSVLQTTFQAKGGGWNNGVQFYANGDIFNKPTAFRHAGGLGVMGEAGPEAVMPLTRGPNGKLGVQVFNNKQSTKSAGVVNQVKIDVYQTHIKNWVQ